MDDKPTNSTFLPWLFFGAKIAGIVFCIFVGVLYYNQESLLYFPNPPGFPVTPDQNPLGFASPDEYTNDGKFISKNRKTSVKPEEKIQFEEKMVETEDGIQIHTWLLLQEDNEINHHPTLIYFHGNAGNMGFRLKNAVDMFSKVKMNILMMDYRGYGRSSGKPTEKGLKQDADSVLKYAASHPKLKGCPVIVFGRSLGGAVAFYLANKFPELVHGIVVENTFLSIGAMVDILMPFLSPLKSLVLNIDWGSDSIIGNILQPIFFISGISRKANCSFSVCYRFSFF
jgi:pimeloyl-ACP methyl ester carboxylesterase